MQDDRNSWELDADLPAAVYNARLLLVVLRCIRSLPKAFPQHSIHTLEECLGPLRSRLGEREIKVLNAVGQGLKPLFEDEFPEDDEGRSTGKADRLALSEAASLFARGDMRVHVIFDNFEDQLKEFLRGTETESDLNAGLLKDLLTLDAAEQALLRLAGDLAHATMDHNMLSFLPRGGGSVRALSQALEVPADQVANAFSVKGRLFVLGLLEWPFGLGGGFVEVGNLFKLTTLGERLMFEPCESLADMSALVLKDIPKEIGPQLTWPHLAVEQKQIERVLAEALSQQMPGVNILLHGAPGTGKTSFAQDLICAAQGNGFLVDCVDDDGDEASRTQRLASLRLNQMFAGQRRRAVIVLDEAEDIFIGREHAGLISLSRRGAGESKAWVNRLLEENPHPVIWITNGTRHMDPAYLRRFTACLQFPEMPRSVRASLAQELLHPVGCSAALIHDIAEQASITPAALQAAATYANLAVGQGGDVDSAVRSHFNQSAVLLGRGQLPPVSHRAQRFDMRYLNLGGAMDLEVVIASLSSDPAAAMLFGGRPGTGKTQLASQIAQRLGRTLVTRSASDINSMWHGQSEANVAEMFRSCDPVTEVLFLDEAEILLTSRVASGHRVERAVTAEFLRWLESFQGTFICATNYPEELDLALVRRFTFRLNFQALAALQRNALFAELALGWDPAAEPDMPSVDPCVQHRLDKLDGLTPGDYANVARRLRRMDLSSVTERWIDELEAEFAAKSQGPKTALGFL